MYAPLEIYLRCGDIFFDVPIPIYGPDGGFVSDHGPAMLIDGDCSICKPGETRFNFAPIWPIGRVDAGTQGNLRGGRTVRRLMYLPADEDRFQPDEFIVDLQGIFSLPRHLFDLKLIELDNNPREKRWMAERNEGVTERLTSLDDEGRRILKTQLVLFFEIDDEDIVG